MPITAIGTSGAAIASATPRHACATVGQLGADGRAGRRGRAGRGRRCARSARCFHRRSARGRVVVVEQRRRRRRSRRRARRAQASASRSIAIAASSRSSTPNSECDATLTGDERVAQQRVRRELVARAPGARRRSRVERGPAASTGRPTRSSARRTGAASRATVIGRVSRVGPDRHVVSWVDASPAGGRRPDQRRRRRSRRATPTASSTPTSAAEAAGVRPRRVPRADGHRLSARGPAAAARVRRRRPPRRSTSSRRAPGACAAVDRLSRARGRDLYNAAAVCANGEVHGVYRKQLLPNYAVFDEQRYFVAVDRRRPALRRSRACRSACRSARTRGAPGPILADGRRRRRARSSTSTRRRTTRAGSRERETMLAARAGRRVRSDRLRRTSSAARTSSCSTARRSCSTSRAGSSPAPSSSPRTCSSSTSTSDVPQALLDPCGRRAAPSRSARTRRASRRIEPVARCTRSTRRSCSARATTCARTASPTC